MILRILNHGRSRIALVLETREASSLAGGKPRVRAGTDTRYVVRAAANMSRKGIELGSFETLEQAQRYADAFQPGWGLLT